MFQLFLFELIEVFDKKNANWRNESVILLDNAAYHTSKSTLKMIQDLEIPVLFLGPYSYLMAPIELYWGIFKKMDLNPNEIPTSKSKYFCNTNPY